MVYRVNLYKKDNQFELKSKKIGPVIVQKKDDGIYELFNNVKIITYLTADQKDKDNNKIYLPHYDDYDLVKKEIEDKGFTLFIKEEDLVLSNKATKEDIDFFMERPSKYAYNRINGIKQETYKKR